MIVRWSLDALGDALDAVGVLSALVVAGPRWDALSLPVEELARWREVPSHRVEDASRAARGAGGVVAVGGGSAIDLGKAVSAATGLPLLSVPTTYSGAEWTTYFGIRSPARKMRGGGAGAHPAAIVYDVELTLGLPLEPTVGTALNALAHCAEALYAHGRNEAADEEALAGARLISDWLPRVARRLDDRDARTALLHGACHGGAALAGSMLALAHAMAQAVGGRYGLPHGTLNGICLPPALRYNLRYAPDALRRLAEAVGGDPASRVEELSRLGSLDLSRPRLRDLGVPERDLSELAAFAATRAGNQANPHPATPEEIERLLREVW